MKNLIEYDRERLRPVGTSHRAALSLYPGKNIVLYFDIEGRRIVQLPAGSRHTLGVPRPVCFGGGTKLAKGVR